MLSVSPFVWIGLLAILWKSYNAIYSLYFSPLSRFPGPKLWAISRLPSQLSILRGHHHLDLLALHNKYGPALRIGPKELAFNSPEAFRDVHGFRTDHKKFPKDRGHYIIPLNETDHLVSAINDSVHSRQRRLLAHAFSERALREQEGLIKGFVDTLILKLREQITTDPNAKIDIRNWMNYTTFDIMGDLMFGESFGCLKDTKLHPWVELLFASIKLLSFTGVVNQFPLLNKLLKKCIPKSVTQKSMDHFNLSAKKADRRLSMGTERPDFMSFILKNGLSEKEGQYREDERIMTRAEIHSNAFIVIIAGSETSATLLSGCIYYVSQNPRILKRLTEEIRSSFATDQQINFADIAKLTYLNAVIEETLRMYPPFVTSLPRISPPGGGSVAGQWVPEDTVVGCHHYASFHSPSNFNLPESFVPERWLGTDPRFASDKKDVLQPFSLGPRNCLGKNLAYAEIRLILSKFFFNFDVKLCEESTNWSNQEVYYLWNKPALMINLSERKLD